MRLPEPTVKENKFSHCADQTRALIYSTQCRKKGTSPTERKNNKF